MRSAFARLLTLRAAGLLLLAAIAAPSMACSGGDVTPTPARIVNGEPVANPTATPEATVVVSADGAVQFMVNVALDGSPQSGTAIFTQIGDTIDVRISLTPAVRAQAVSILRGKCPNPTGFYRHLDPVIGGFSSQTMEGVPMSELASGGLTLVIDSGSSRVNDFVGCADLPDLDLE
jgi:hypothetical protein